MQDTLKSSVSERRQKLIVEMQRINFGSIKNLALIGGEPIFTKQTKPILNVKFGSENGVRKESNLNDFALKNKVQEMFSHFDLLGDATILNLEIKNGLPFSMQIEEVPA